MKYLWLILPTMLTACSWHAKRNPMDENLSRVLVVDDSNKIVTRMLQQAMIALPDSEPQFDVTSTTSDGMKSLDRYRPLIVRTEINHDQSRTELAYSKNVYANEQTVVTLRAASYKQLQHDLAKGQLQSLLHQQIVQREKKHIETAPRNPLNRTIKQQFGIDIMLPPTLNRSKQADNFIWASSDDENFMLNICIYLGENRDSIMQQNIKGQTDAQYMVTTPGTTVQRRRQIGQTLCTERRGLWHMKGDAMGGPYMSIAIPHPDSRHTITIEAFAYAPTRHKRDLMRLAEAIILTAINTQHK